VARSVAKTNASRAAVIPATEEPARPLALTTLNATLARNNVWRESEMEEGKCNIMARLQQSAQHGLIFINFATMPIDEQNLSTTFT